jgi:hypothetical protein
MNKLCQFTFALMLFVVAFSSASAQESSRRDGNWWRDQTKLHQANYITGFFDGMELGNRFSIWKHLHDKKAGDAVYRAVTSYNEYLNKYFGAVTAGQLVDGLNDFYADYRNRSIKLHDGIWLVVNQIAGTPKEEVDLMVENWRKNVVR